MDNPKTEWHPTRITALDLLLPVPEAETQIVEVSSDTALDALDDNSIDLLKVNRHIEPTLPAATCYKKIRHNGILCVSFTGLTAADTAHRMNQYHEQLAAHSFTVTETYTSLPDPETAKLVIPFDNRVIRFAMHATLNYRHPTLNWLQQIGANYLSPSFFLKKRMTNFTIIARK